MLQATLIPAAQTTGELSGIMVAAYVSQVVIAAAILVLAILGGMLFWRMNVLLRELQRSAKTSLAPVSDRAGRITDNVEFITQALRTDVEALNASVRSLSERLQLASDRMEDRVEEFNALMEVVQGEAEEMFLDTASTVRGVREGARTITERAASRATSEDDAALEDAPEGSFAGDPDAEHAASVTDV
jgi:methyl-accepting chemotaxis protein